MTINITKEMDSEFTVLEIQKKRVLFTVNKVNRRTAPYGLYIYDVRHTTGKPYKIKNRVFINHFGTIISKVPLEKGTFDESEFNGTMLYPKECQVLRDYCGDLPSVSLW
jgi:hypothetical protein